MFEIFWHDDSPRDSIKLFGDLAYMVSFYDREEEGSILSQRISYLVVLLGAILWGTTGTAQTFMPQTIHPLAVGASRLAVGGFSLLLILLIMRKIDFRKWPWKSTLYAAIFNGYFSIFIFFFC